VGSIIRGGSRSSRCSPRTQPAGAPRALCGVRQKCEHISFRKKIRDMQANQLGARLKEIRRMRDRTLAQVSQASGVSISNLAKIENNQSSPSFDIMKRICDGLGVSIEDFVRPGAKSEVSGRKTTTREGEGDHFTSGQYDYRTHGSELSHKAMMPLE